MSDSFSVDALLEGLRGQRPPAPFAPSAAVRRRGRQRANRQAVSIGVAVLAVTGLGAGGTVAALDQPQPPPVEPAGTTAAGPASPTEVPRTPAEPSPSGARRVVTEVPGSWLLTAGDLAGTGWREDTGELLDGAWYWDGAEPWCPAYRLSDYRSVPQRVDVRLTGWIREGGTLPERVDQLVELYPAGVGTTNVADVRAFIERCSLRSTPGGAVAPIDYEVEETGFAGDESLLIRAEPHQFTADDQIVPTGEHLHVAVVRVGDTVTTIQFLNHSDERDDVRAVARRAAARLR